MTPSRKRVRDLTAGDRLALKPHGVGRVTSCKPSHSTMVKPRAGGPEAVAWIVVFEAIDGPMVGVTDAEFRHPDDEVAIR